jgi:hypothetical protein
MGDICRAKDRADLSTKKTQVKPLFSCFHPRRSYLVITTPIRKVTVMDTGSKRFAVCECQPAEICEHIRVVAEIDNTRFPQKEQELQNEFMR